jgi:hypothetical protein
VGVLGRGVRIDTCGSLPRIGRGMRPAITEFPLPNLISETSLPAPLAALSSLWARNPYSPSTKPS